MTVYRGNPGMVVASSIIVPTNTNLILRGTVGQQLLATYGPVPQNSLFARAPVKAGTVTTLQVASPAPGVPARWYCAAAYPADVVTASWFVTTGRAQVAEAYAAAIAQVSAEGQFPCAIPLFADTDFIAADPAGLAALVDLMVNTVTLPDGFFFIADNPVAHDALLAAVAPPPATPEPEVAAASDEEPATVLASTPAKRRGGRRKGNANE